MEVAAAAAAKSLQSCPTLCDPIDGSPPGSPVPGILQARTLEWVAISISHAWKWKMKVKSFRRIRPSATPWTAAHQAPPSMGFSRQEYWSGVPLPSPYGGWSYINSYMFYLIFFFLSSLLHFYPSFINNLVVARVLLRLRWEYSQIKIPMLCYSNWFLYHVHWRQQSFTWTKERGGS